jgi:HEAT repeats
MGKWMERKSTGRGKKLLLAVMVLAVAGGVLWWQRLPLLCRYEIYRLSQVEESELPAWVDRVVRLDEAAVPGLIGLLQSQDPQACANATRALSALGKLWGPADSRTAALAEQMTSALGSASTPGREAILEWHMAALQALSDKKEGAQLTIMAASSLLPAAAVMEDAGIQVRTLALAELLLARRAGPSPGLCRDLAIQGLASKKADIRAHAIRLMIHQPLAADKELVARIVPLLKDSEPEVRRAAVLAVGLMEEAIATQDLLPLLQDADAGVRQLCEKALRGRGLGDTHIKLANRITDPRPGERLKVFPLLTDPDAENLDSAVWLMHLSRDSSPAVRAAAIRFAAADAGPTDFRERIQQMAREDPSGTVRQLAEYYLKYYQKRD